MVRQRKSARGVSSGRRQTRTTATVKSFLNGRRKAPATFKKGLLLIGKELEKSKLKSVKSQAGLALRLAKHYFQGSKVTLPKSVALKTVSGGFLLATLAGIASLVSTVSGISTIVSNYKKLKSDSERLKIERKRGDLLETYFLGTAVNKNKVGGAGFHLRKRKTGFLIQFKKCAKKTN